MKAIDPRLVVVTASLLRCAPVVRAAQYDACGGDLQNVGDGYCDSNNNDESCGYDGGDCCPCTCTDCSSGSGSSLTSFHCLDPNAPCVDPFALEYPNCTYGLGLIGDGRCDRHTNNPDCGFDGGDCCECTCVDGLDFTCGDSTLYYCADPNTTCVDPLVVEYPGCAGIAAYIGDGFCDDKAWGYDNNNAACDYDGGDCCNCTCVDGPEFSCDDDATNGYRCLDETCSEAIGDAYPNCTEGRLDTIGDGECNSYNNNPSCGYDGGDCCRCTCESENEYACGEDTFDCLDSKAALSEIYNCDQPPNVLPCPATIQREWLIETSAEACTLAVAVGCSSGVFDVEWRGSIVVEQTIHVLDGTVLSVTGGGGDAVLDGNGVLQLFTVVNASLNLSGVNVTKGGAFSGGAIAAKGSTMTFVDTRFTANGAVGGHGGALFITDGSDVSFHGKTFFEENIARDENVASRGSDRVAGSGGAVYVHGWCNVSWSGEAAFTRNTASFSNGGALMVVDSSSVFLSGKAAFEGNRASFGGAVFVDEESYVSWSASMSFCNNSATRGGALTAQDHSNVSWSGETSFYNNSGWEGGALYSHHTTHMSWTGNTLFSNNAAAQDGGAVFMDGGSTLYMSGPTTFTGNHAVSTGGAIGSRQLEPGAFDAPCFLYVESSARFVRNTSGVNGGAIVFLGLMSITLLTTDVAFVENSADVAGGAIFISGTGIGPILAGIMFDSNRAQLGGAVYAVGSGTTFTGSQKSNPTTLVGCTFVGNEAVASGGAVESAAGRDAVVGSRFEGNRAGVGGALRLAGTAAFENCTFERNVSQEKGGSAVSNVGYIEQARDNKFIDNIFSCPAGEYLDFVEAQSGEVYAMACDGCDSLCAGCRVASDSIPRCALQMDHSRSQGGIATIEEVIIEVGFWRATPTSEEVLPCYNYDACLGGVTSRPGYCAPGYGGPYCSICNNSYTSSVGFTCTKCSPSEVVIATMGLATLAVLLGFLALISYLISGKARGRRQGMAERLKQYIPVQSLKIIIVAWQILTQFASVTNVTFPEKYQRFLSMIAVINFDLAWVVSTNCLVDVNFHHRLLISTIGPLLALSVLGMTYTLAAWMNRESRDALRNVRHKHMSMVLLLTFFVYSSVSSTLFQMFACERLDDGKRYLRADYRIDCDSVTHKDFQAYAGVMIMLYTVGIPILFSYLLFKHSKVLMEESCRETSSKVRSISDLWKPYKPDRFYYEVLECGRRIMLASMVVFIFPNTAAQVAVAAMMTLVFLLGSEVLAPYASAWDTWLSRMGHVNVFTSMYVALLLKVNVSDERAESQAVFAAVLITAHVFMVFMVVVEAIVMACSLRQEVAEEEPRRRDLSCRSVILGRGAFLPQALEDFDEAMVAKATAMVEVEETKKC